MAHWFGPPKVEQQIVIEQPKIDQFFLIHESGHPNWTAELEQQIFGIRIFMIMSCLAIWTAVTRRLLFKLCNALMKV